MQIPSIGAEALLNSMRVQIAQFSNGPQQAQQIQQIEAQTVRRLDTLDAASGSAKGSNLDVTA